MSSGEFGAHLTGFDRSSGICRTLTIHPAVPYPKEAYARTNFWGDASCCPGTLPRLELDSTKPTFWPDSGDFCRTATKQQKTYGTGNPTGSHEYKLLLDELADKPDWSDQIYDISTRAWSGNSTELDFFSSSTNSALDGEMSFLYKWPRQRAYMVILKYTMDSGTGQRVILAFIKRTRNF